MVVEVSKCVNLNNVRIPYCNHNDFPRTFINYANYCHVFYTILLKQYWNLPTIDIKYMASWNSTALGKVCPLPIMEFWNWFESRSSIFDSEHLWENPYDSTIRESLQMSIGGSPWEETICAKFKPTIGVGALQIKHKNKFFILDKVNVMLVRPYVPSRCDIGYNNFNRWGDIDMTKHVVESEHLQYGCVIMQQ